jgi:hypothetical protein
MTNREGRGGKVWWYLLRYCPRIYMLGGGISTTPSARTADLGSCNETHNIATTKLED